MKCVSKGKHAVLTKSSLVADAIYRYLGLSNISLATTYGVLNIYSTIDIVLADVHAILGMDVPGFDRVPADTVFNEILRTSVTKYPDGESFPFHECIVPLP